MFTRSQQWRARNRFIGLVSVLTLAPQIGQAEALVDGTWSALDAALPAPGARREYAAVYDRNNERYVIFAGLAGHDPYYLVNEVWALTLGTSPSWSPLSVTGSPPGERASAQWGYDPARNRILIFGGYGRHHPGWPFEYLNDVWELTLDGTPTWNELFPSGTPPVGRLAGTAVYDVFRQRFVGFGGTRGLPVDTWQLDLSGEPAWSTLPADGPEPPGSYGMTSIFDAARNRLIVFGGSTSDAYLGCHNDTWELRLTPQRPVWRKLDPMGPLPVGRRTLASIYDPLRNRMVIFGGWNGTYDPDAFLHDTWALSLTPNPSGDGEWTQLSPAGLVPGVRDAMSAIHDPGSDRLVLFGGWSGTSMLGDTQFLTWGGKGLSASVTPNGQPDPGVARLEWGTNGATGPTGGIYRRETGTEWRSIAAVQADASGTLRFDDYDVTPGGVYGYKVVVPSELGDECTGETWVTIPSTTEVGAADVALALGPVGSNPVSGPFGISFSLPSAGPALLEMMDVSGRRLLARDVSGFGAGQHQLQMGQARDYASGVYFVHLSQQGRRATTKIVVVRAP